MQTGRDDLSQLYTHLGAKLVEDISLGSTANILAAPSSRFRFSVSATQMVKLRAKWDGIDPLLGSRSLKKRWTYLAIAFALVIQPFSLIRPGQVIVALLKSSAKLTN